IRRCWRCDTVHVVDRSDELLPLRLRQGGLVLPHVYHEIPRFVARVAGFEFAWPARRRARVPPRCVRAGQCLAVRAQWCRLSPPKTRTAPSRPALDLDAKRALG